LTYCELDERGSSLKKYGGVLRLHCPYWLNSVGYQALISWGLRQTEMKLTSHLHLVSRFIKRESLPPVLLLSFMVRREV
jgi:hypothetical protein